jgi:adenylate cyclase
MKLEVLTIVFVDIKDYTSKTAGQSRLANEQLLARFSALVKPMVREFRGRVIKSIGDAFLITFRSPTDALLCSMAVQDQLAKRNPLFPPVERFELRFAINAGEVRVDRGDVFGSAVNVAARIEGLAKGGEIYFSESVYLMMNKSEVPFESLGKHKLKGVGEALGVYRIPKISEVGSYKLHQAEDTPDAAPAPHKEGMMPYGGLALSKVHSNWAGLAMETDGLFYFGGAVSEIHYSASAVTQRFVALSWQRKVLGPIVYLGAYLAASLKLIGSGRTYQGLWARLSNASKLLRQSRQYRRRFTRIVALPLLLLAALFLGWRGYAAIQEARAYKALAEQREAAAMKAQAREAAAQRALSQEKKKIHFPW